MVRGYRVPLPIIERLERRSIWLDDCHFWRGAKSKDGYGRITVGSRIDGSRRLEAVHRAAWFAYYDEWPPGHMDVDHICHVHGCWAQDHLRLLTPAENRSTSYPALTEIRRANLVKARATLRGM